MSRPGRRITAALALSLLWGCAAGTPGAPARPTGDSTAGPRFPTTAPEPGPVPSLAVPAPTRRSLANGLEVVYVRHGTLPVAHATLVIRGGSTEDPPDRPGLAAFTAAMLDEGAGGRGALELSAELARLGATLGTGAGWDAAHVNLHVLSPQLPEALQLVADVVARPDFPLAELERLRRQELTDLSRAADEPRAIAANAFASLVYGPDHPYGRITTTSAIEAIDQQELREFHRRFYRPGAATLILVGDVEPDVLHPLVEQAFGDWSAGPPPESSHPLETPETGATTIYLIDKPDAAQSEIRIGHPGVARDHPDYFPLVVLNTILGGSFTSRLNTNLRETHGFSYGAGSSFAMRRAPGPFTASSAVITAKTDSALSEFFFELRRIRDEAVSPDELARARSYLALGLPRRFETTSGVASQIAELETYGQSVDFYNDYIGRVMAVTARDVQRVAREHLKPDRSVVVIVGDRSEVEPGLRALGLGPLEVRETAEFVR